MGAEESKETRSVDSSFMLVEERPIPEILFDPINSRAVCAGVGRHLNMRRKPNDIPTCDHDTGLIYEVLTDKLCIPGDNVRVLNSSRDSQYPATVCNVEDSLKVAVDKIGPGGILLFYFSGHGIRYGSESKAALVAADFVDNQRQLITARNLADALVGLKERSSQLVLIFDCCFAAGIASELGSILGSLGFKVCAIAACSAVENSVCFERLGAGFFTYFLHDFMSRTKPFSCLPVKSLSEYCIPLCNAMATLVLKEDGINHGQLVDASMHPTVITTQLQLDVTDDQYLVSPVSDEPDGPGSGPAQTSKAFQLLAYQSPEDFMVDKAWSEQVSLWLNTKAAPSLRVLKEGDFLKKRNLIETVLCLMTRSVAMLTAAKQPKLALKPNIFILSYFRMVELLLDLEPEAMKGSDDYMALTILYYIKGVVEYLNKPLSQLGKLVDLFSALSSDQTEMQIQEKTGQDEADGGTTTLSVLHDLEHTIPKVPVGFDDLP